MRTFISLFVFTVGLVGCHLTEGQAQSAHSISPEQTAPAVESLMSLPQQGPTSTSGRRTDPSMVKANGAHVRIAVEPQYRHLLFSAEQVLNVRLHLEADDVGSTERPPLDLALVLDTSGSMSGEKLRDAKAAALSLLSSLDRRDRVTLIAYASHVQRIANRVTMDNAGRRHLTQHILGLRAGGSTALGPALEDAAQVLNRSSGGSLMLRHVILMSDGVANVGESRPDILAARARQAFRNGISLSTMGVGLDYNEDLMTKVADMGGGRYHFIEDSANIASVLNDEFQGLVATVARDVLGGDKAHCRCPLGQSARISSPNHGTGLDDSNRIYGQASKPRSHDAIHHRTRTQPIATAAVGPLHTDIHRHRERRTCDALRHPIGCRSGSDARTAAEQ